MKLKTLALFALTIVLGLGMFANNSFANEPKSAPSSESKATSAAASSSSSSSHSSASESKAMMAASETKPVIVGGAAMYATKNIVENAINSKDHTTLVTALKAAGLVETLQGKGPFTVFAPTNAAFAKLPAGTVEGLLKPESKASLTGILTYHVVPGTYTSAKLAELCKEGKGQTSLKTVAGGSLTIKQTAKGLEVADAKGGSSSISIADVTQSNGVIHVVDSVLMPSSSASQSN